MSVTHDDSLDITVTLQPPFPAVAGFSNLLLLELAADNSTNNPVISYTESDLDQLENDWTTAIREHAETYFSQRPAPSKILVGEWDKVGGQSISDALDAIGNANPNWFYIASTIRDNADQNDISNAVESYSKPSVYILQSDVDDIVASADLSSTSNNGIENIPGRERTFGIYHTDNTENCDAALAGKIAAFDPDNTSAPWYGTLKGVSGYGSLPTGASIGTQQNPGNLRDNGFNAVLPFGSTNTWLAPGQNANQRQGKVILTRYWLQSRLQADVANEIQTAEARGKIIPVGAEGESETAGQIRMSKLVRSRYDQGETIGHFLPENLDIDYPDITATDVSNGIIPLEAQMTVAIGGQAVTFDLFFSREPV